MNIKKVKIDDHIKQVRTSTQPVKRGRGRPRKVPLVTESGAGNAGTVGVASPKNESPELSERSEHFASAAIDHGATEPLIEPAYDTTPEAKGLIGTPFAAFAMLFKNKDIMLDDHDYEFIMPTWKPIYDLDIKPKMGENARFIAFGSAFSVLLLKKYQIIAKIRKERAELEKAKKEFEQMRNPSDNNIRSEVVA